MLDKGTISPRQLFFAVCCFILSSTLLTSFLFAILDTDSWMSYVLGMLFILPILGVYLYLARQFPQKNLMQINSAVFGPVLGFIISAGYLWFFFTLSALTLTDVAGLIRLTLMPESPPVIIKLLLVLVSAWSVRNGVESIARFGMAFVYTSVFVTAISIIFTLDRMNVANFLPLFSAPAPNYPQAVHTAFSIPYGELVVFLMLTPAVNNQQKVTKSFLWGFIAGAFMLIITVLRDTAILGHVAGLFTIPSYESFRVVSISQAITRIDMLFAIILIIFVFFKLSIFYYGSALGVAQLMNLNDYKPIVGVTGMFLLIYSISVVSDVIAHLGTAITFVPWLWSLFQIVLPLLTLLVFLVKKWIGKKKAASPAKVPA